MDRRRRRPGRVLVGVLAVLVAVALAACGDDDSTSTTTSTLPDEVPTAVAVSTTIAAIYAALVDIEEPRPVIVAPLYEGTGFSIEVQADVVATLAGEINVQFIDEAELALVDDGNAVVDDALLLRVALNDLPGPTAKVTGDWWSSVDDIVEFVSEVSFVAGEWVADVTIG